MGDLAKLTIWDDPSIRSALSWYLDVAENRRPGQVPHCRDRRHTA
jgi:hypothetical protein